MKLSACTMQMYGKSYCYLKKRFLPSDISAGVKVNAVKSLMFAGLKFYAAMWSAVLPVKGATFWPKAIC